MKTGMNDPSTKSYLRKGKMKNRKNVDAIKRIKLYTRLIAFSQK